jgi:hypothetical protein
MIFVIVAQTVSAALRIIMTEYNKITAAKIDRIKRDLTS